MVQLEPNPRGSNQKYPNSSRSKPRPVLAAAVGNHVANFVVGASA